MLGTVEPGGLITVRGREGTGSAPDSQAGARARSGGHRLRHARDGGSRSRLRCLARGARSDAPLARDRLARACAVPSSRPGHRDSGRLARVSAKHGTGTSGRAISGPERPSGGGFRAHATSRPGGPLAQRGKGNAVGGGKRKPAAAGAARRGASPGAARRGASPGAAQRGASLVGLYRIPVERPPWRGGSHRIRFGRPNRILGAPGGSLPNDLPARGGSGVNVLRMGGANDRK